MDITEWHSMDELPPDSNMVIIAIRGCGKSITVCRGYYTAAWGIWLRAGGKTPINPEGWAYLIKWEGNNNET